jgi:TonB family protein
MTEDKKTAPELSYVNLYNIRLDSSREREGIFFDETNGLKLSRRSFSPYNLFPAEVNLNVEEAKRLKETTKAVVLVQFEEPYASEWIGRQQFQVRLIDVYFFDPQTGKILAKMSLAGKEAVDASAPRDNSAISGGVLNGKAVSLPTPLYPKKARAARAFGIVTVQVTIDEIGRVISAHAVSGHPLLQEAAVQAAYQARFTPTLLMGQPVKVTGVITYNFQL